MPLIYSDVVALLERAVGGPGSPVGFHGPFWRKKTRDEFVATPAFRGVVPIVVGDSAASGIIAALMGTGAFNSSAGGIERMPPFGPYLTDTEIAAIAEWIDAGCPEEAVNPGEGGTGMPELRILVVKDHVKMGQLIERMAADESLRPQLEDFNELLMAEGIVDRVPAGDFEPHWPHGRPDSIQYVKIADNVQMVSIPSPLAIAEGRTLAEQLSTNGYPFPRGYDLNYQNPARKPSLTDPEWETIYRTRLGDYTIGKCM